MFAQWNDDEKKSRFINASSDIMQVDNWKDWETQTLLRFALPLF